MSRALINPAAQGDAERVPAASDHGVPSTLSRSDGPPSPYGQVPLDQGQPLAVTLRQYLYMVLKRRWLIVGIAAAFTLLGGLHAFLKTPLYTAKVRLQIEREPSKIVEGGATTPVELGSSDFLRTQFELLKSRALAERVAGTLHLSEDTSFLKPREFSLTGLLLGGERKPPSPSQSQAGATRLLLLNMAVLPVPGSRLVDVTYLDPSPWRAQQVANGYAEAFIAANLDKRFEANAYAKTFLDDQIKQLKLRLEDSEKTLLDFAEREKMIEVTDKASIADNNLAAANATLGQLISERMKNEQLWRQVDKSNAINLPQFLSNPVIEVLRGQRKTLDTEYQEKLESYKPDYPLMVQIRNKIKEVDRQLGAEVKAIQGSLKNAYESSLALENETKVRIETLKSEVLDLQKKGIEYSILKREVETNRGLYNSLLQRYKEVDVAGGAGTNNIFIVDRADLPGAPSEPNIPRSLAMSLALGLAAGCGLALLLELLDDRLRAPEEVEQLSGLATIGIIPIIETGQSGIDEGLQDPRSSIAEAYRSLGTALQFSSTSGLPKSLCITSSGPSEGKSTTALYLARHFAQMGLRVLLVDADLRKPSLHTKLNAKNHIGLSNYLTGTGSPPELVQQTDLPNLAFMPSGPLPPNAADLLSGTRLFTLISIGSEVFELIIFDSPPLLGLADAQLIASAAAATVFVVGAGEKGKGMIRQALRRLQLARIFPVGAVLTKFNPKAVGYTYGYGYGYGYGGYGYEYGYGNRGYSSGYGLENQGATQPQISKHGKS